MNYVNKWWLLNAMISSNKIEFNNFSKSDLVEMLNILHIFMYCNADHFIKERIEFYE